MLRPVNRLSPEILSRIARYFRDDFNGDTSAILPLTHVCRYWRESIISTPENWTIISDSRRNLTAVSLERAKAAPLEVHLDMGAIREDRQFLDLLIPHFQNTRTLRVSGLMTFEDLSLFNRYPMISLRSLTLSESDKGDDWNRSIDPFKSSAYALQYLKLVGVPLYPSFRNLRTLTGLDLHDPWCNLHLDTLLDFLEGNRSLTSARLEIRFTEPSLRRSWRRAPIGNRLRSLRITYYDVMDGRALISSIALSKGAELELNCSCYNVGVNDVLSGMSTSHLSNLLSPIIMRYRVHSRVIELLGPNGTASLINRFCSDIPFGEFPQLPLANIRQFHLDVAWWEPVRSSPGPITVHHLSFFPALETFAIKRGAYLSHLLSALLSNPSAAPSLKTLAFFNCLLTEELMEELRQFASNRKKTSSAWLHRVVIIHSGGMLPTIASICALEEYVPVVDARIATKLPTDL